MNSGTTTEHLKIIFSHDIKYWKGIADTVLIWALGFAGLAAVVVGLSTWLSMTWGDEISDFNERALARYQLETEGKVAEAEQAGIKAGTDAAEAHGVALKAKADIATQTAIAEQLRLEVAQAGASAAEANARTADFQRQADLARLETEKLKIKIAPRDFSQQDRFILQRELSSHRASINIVYAAGDPETQAFATKIAQLLQQSGWGVAFQRCLPAAHPYRG